MPEKPRGIRNHNPGNLRRSDDKWQGLAKEQPDPEFFVFSHATYGIRALARTLITYQDRYSLRSIETIIGRWAPPSENDTEAYVDAIARSVKKSRSVQLDMHSYRDLRPLTEAIILHENGVMPYTSAQIDKALALAGVEPKRKPLTESRTVNAGTAAVAGTAGTGVVEVIQGAQDAITPLSYYLDMAKYVLLALVLASVGYMLYARWDDWRKLAR